MLLGICNRSRLIREDSDRAEVVTIGEIRSFNDERPLIPASGRRRAFNTKHAGTRWRVPLQHNRRTAGLRA